MIGTRNMRKESKNHVHVKDYYYVVMSILSKKHNSQIKAICRGNENRLQNLGQFIIYFREGTAYLHSLHECL